MRRIAIVLGLLLLLALLAFWALSGGDDGSAGRSGPGATGPDGASAETENAARARQRDRAAGAEAEVAADEPGVSEFLRRFPEIGQDKEQDPALSALTGQAYAAPGVPAAEFVVEAVRRGEVLARARVRQGPRFLLKNVAPGDGIGLAIVSEAHAPGGMDKLILRAGETLDVGTVYLGLATDPTVDNRIEVVVKSGATPLAGAQVTASTVSYRTLVTLGNLEKTPGGTILRAAADEAGRVVFERIPPGRYDVFAEKDGYAFEVEEQTLVQARSKTTYTMDLDPGLTIEGRVVTEEGAPVPGCRIVSLRWGSFTNVPTVTTDTEGRFAAKGLPPGNYLVVAAKEDLGGKEMQQIPAGTKDLEIVLAAGGDIWLKCVDAATGEPVKDFGLRPYRKMPFAYLYAPLIEAQTADGEFRTKLLPASDYGVEVTATGYAMNNVAAVPVPAKEAVVVRMEPAGIVRGKVVSKSSGAPVRGASVFVKRGGFPPTKVKDQTTVTDAEGFFTLLHLPRRALTITISHVDHDEAAFEGVEPVPAPPAGQTAEARTFELGSGGSVSGRVLAPGGGVLAGQRMTLLRGFDFTTLRTATTDANGTYLFTHVPPAEKYTLAVGDFTPGRPGRSRNDVSVREGETTTVDFGADATGMRVAGKVVRDEVAVGGQGVQIVAQDGGGFQAQERTGDDGSFAFAAVPPGKYVLRAGNKAVDLVVPADQPPADVVLALSSGSVAGTITDRSTGKPLAGVWVNCSYVPDASGSGYAELVRTSRGDRTTGAEGRIEFTGLEDGVYVLRAYRDGYGTELASDIRIANGAPVSVSIEMGPACTLTGMVRDSRGLPLEGAAIQVRDLAGRRVFGISFASSEGDGRFTQGALRPDTYDVTAEKDGFAPTTQRVTVTAGSPASADFTLLVGGRLEVVARSADGAAMKDVSVTLLDASGKPVVRGVTVQNVFSAGGVRTDAAGVATLSGLLPGTYAVRAVKAGATEGVVVPGVVVIDGSTARSEVVLP